MVEKNCTEERIDKVTKMKSKSNRNLSIEVLRIVLMLFIIMHHCIVNGYGLQAQLKGTGLEVHAQYSAFLSVLNSIVVIGVNIFFMISGYFQIRFSLEKFLKLIIDIYLYNTILTVLALIFGKASLNMHTLQYLVLPFQKYWFILVYLILMVISPLLNKALDELEEKTVKTVYIAVFLITCIYGFVFEATWLGLNNGYSVMFAMFLYYTGYMMRRYGMLGKGKQITHAVKWCVYTIVTASIACICIYIGKKELAWSCFSYNQPFMVLASVHFFWIFIKGRTNGDKLLAKYVGMAKHILPVYYIHTSTIFSYYRNLPLEYVGKMYNEVLQVLFVVVYALLIFFICVLIDVIKVKMLDGVVVRGQKWLGTHLTNIWEKVSL